MVTTKNSHNLMKIKTCKKSTLRMRMLVLFQHWLMWCGVADCPQVQAVTRFQATEPDELLLEESDVVNVFRKVSDGK